MQDFEVVDGEARGTTPAISTRKVVPAAPRLRVNLRRAELRRAELRRAELRRAKMARCRSLRRMPHPSQLNELHAGAVTSTCVARSDMERSSDRRAAAT